MSAITEWYSRREFSEQYRFSQRGSIRAHPKCEKLSMRRKKNRDAKRHRLVKRAAKRVLHKQRRTKRRAMPAKKAPDKILVKELKLSSGTKNTLISKGFNTVADFKDTYFPDLQKLLSFEQSKELLKQIFENEVSVRFAQPDWTEERWRDFVKSMVTDQTVTWREIAMAVCGELNPPQVGTAIASNKSFQKHFPKGETMKNVMAWFYAQKGCCTECGTRLFLEADHIRSKQDFRDAGEDPLNADTLGNLQLLCKRCNVIKRPSHALGGISFAPAQSVLVWILLTLRPKEKKDFYVMCRDHGLTMANIRFDEAWAFAEWLKKEGKYP